MVTSEWMQCYDIHSNEEIKGERKTEDIESGCKVNIGEYAKLKKNY